MFFLKLHYVELSGPLKKAIQQFWDFSKSFSLHWLLSELNMVVMTRLMRMISNVYHGFLQMCYLCWSVTANIYSSKSSIVTWWHTYFWTRLKGNVMVNTEIHSLPLWGTEHIMCQGKWLIKQLRYYILGGSWTTAKSLNTQLEPLNVIWKWFTLGPKATNKTSGFNFSTNKNICHQINFKDAIIT